jgi:predicted RNase H-like HicB family nuclease
VFRIKSIYSQGEIEDEALEDIQQALDIALKTYKETR